MNSKTIFKKGAKRSVMYRFLQIKTGLSNTCIFNMHFKNEVLISFLKNCTALEKKPGPLPWSNVYNANSHNSQLKNDLNKSTLKKMFTVHMLTYLKKKSCKI